MGLNHCICHHLRWGQLPLARPPATCGGATCRLRGHLPPAVGPPAACAAIPPAVGPPAACAAIPPAVGPPAACAAIPPAVGPTAACAAMPPAVGPTAACAATATCGGANCRLRGHLPPAVGPPAACAATCHLRWGQLPLARPPATCGGATCRLRGHCHLRWGQLPLARPPATCGGANCRLRGHLPPAVGPTAACAATCHLRWGQLPLARPCMGMLRDWDERGIRLWVRCFPTLVEPGWGHRLFLHLGTSHFREAVADPSPQNGIAATSLCDRMNSGVGVGIATLSAIHTMNSRGGFRQTSMCVLNGL